MAFDPNGAAAAGEKNRGVLEIGVHGKDADAVAAPNGPSDATLPNQTIRTCRRKGDRGLGNIAVLTGLLNGSAEDPGSREVNLRGIKGITAAGDGSQSEQSKTKPAHARMLPPGWLRIKP